MKAYHCQSLQPTTGVALPSPILSQQFIPKRVNYIDDLDRDFIL